MSRVVIRKKGDKRRYDVYDADCIGRSCLRIHEVVIRGSYMDGSSREIDRRACCARREGFGCPMPTPEFDKELAAERRAAGMSVQRR